MSKQTGIFFYYTTATITLLLIGSIFFLPEPFNFAIPIVLLPSFVFFWLKITNPQDATENVWSMRLIFLFLSLAALGLFGFYLQSDSQKEISELETENERLITEARESSQQVASLSGEIAMLRQDLKKAAEESENNKDKELDAQAISDLLGTLDENDEASSPSILGEIKVISSEEINVFEKADIASRILGIAETTTNYDFYKKEDGWYLIQFNDKQEGWVKDDFVTEIN